MDTTEQDDPVFHPSQDKTTGLWGFRGITSGKVRIRCRWRAARSFHEDLAAVRDRETGLWGFIDLLGHLSLPPRWSGAGDFHEGFAAVCDPSSGLWSYIGKDGQLLGVPRWRTVEPFSEGRAAVCDPTTELWGYIDNSGEIAIVPHWESAWEFRDGFATVRSQIAVNGARQSAEGIIDQQGRVIIPAEWYSIELRRYLWLPSAADHFEAHSYDGEIAIFSLNGDVIIPAHALKDETSEQLWMAKMVANGTVPPYDQALFDDIPARARNIIDAGPTSLVGIGELFAGVHSFARWPLPEIDLRAAGLWERRVAMIEPFDAPCGTRIGAGATGFIGWTKPATYKMFDLKVATPVDGLPVPSGTTVAVPWRLLRLMP